MRYVGYADVDIRCDTHTDAEQDALLDQACADRYHANGVTSAAANTLQLIRGLIDNLPADATDRSTRYTIFKLPEPPECVALRRTSPDRGCRAAPGDGTGYHRNAIHPGMTWPTGCENGRDNTSPGWDDTSNARTALAGMRNLTARQLHPCRTNPSDNSVVMLACNRSCIPVPHIDRQYIHELGFGHHGDTFFLSG